MNQSEQTKYLIAQIEQGGQTINLNQDGLKAELSRSYEHIGLTVKILSVFGGIVAAFFLALFLGLGGVLSSYHSMCFIGFIMLIVVMILVAETNNILLETAIVCFYVMGWGLIWYSLGQIFRSTAIDLVACTIIGLVTLYLTRHYLLHILAVLGINWAISVALTDFPVQDVFLIQPLLIGAILLYMSVHETRLVSGTYRVNLIFEPLLLGLYITAFMLVMALAQDGKYGVSLHYSWLISLASAAAMLYLLSKIMPQIGIHQHTAQQYIYAGISLLMCFTFMAPAIMFAMFLLMLSFHYKYQVVFYCCIALLLYSIGQYYYDLNLTLLQKSIILMLAGLLLLVIWWFFQKKTKELAL